MCTGQVGPTGRSVGSGAAEPSKAQDTIPGSCCAFRASWGQANVHAPAPWSRKSCLPVSRPAGTKAGVRAPAPWSRKSCLPVSTSQAPVNPPRPRPPPHRCRHTPPAVTTCAYLPACLPLPWESRTPALLGASREELESKRGWLLYVILDTGYLRCRCSFRGKRYVWGTRGEGVIVHA